MTKRFVMNTPNDWGFPITDNVTGKVYSCDSNILMKDLCNVVNSIVEENEQLKQSFINLIDKKIEEFKNGDYGDLPCNTIHMFLDLKEELSGDVE